MLRMMLDLRDILMGCAAYLRQHPQELLLVARKAGRMRLGVPISALRWAATQFQGGVRDIEFEPIPPGMRVTATLEEMGTTLRCSAVLTVERIATSPTEIRLEMQLADVSVRLLDEQGKTPLAALIRSGALDLSKVTSLVAHLPTRPAILVDAVGDRLVVDLMRLPQFDRDDRLRRIWGGLSSLLAVETLQTDDTHLDVGFKALPRGIKALWFLR
jgi:hypothetical protein